MMQYIDKSAIAAEIKRRIILLENNSDGIISMLASGMFVNEYKDLLSFLDTLEVKDVDLEKEIDNIWNPRFNLGWDEKSLLSINHSGFTTIAKYFFELGLGLKTRKGDRE